MTVRMITVAEAIADAERKFEAVRSAYYRIDLGNTEANARMRQEIDRVVNDGLAGYYVRLRQYLGRGQAGSSVEPEEGDE
ncbi:MULTISPECIES: hypothetical protein [unclassified Bradyrhizobium]|uniref:hypothetical protein n=1 Tax=unclassified Bradyrhizobium TaxID=2631580 RepID=UPI0028E842D6|nr:MULTISPECIES: hypothetical protein [unclassified Bradyrhizobium]